MFSQFVYLYNRLQQRILYALTQKISTEDLNLSIKMSSDGFDLLWKNQISDAEFLFRKAIKLNKNSATGHAGLARILRIHGKIKSAFKHSLIALSLEPNNQYILEVHARILRDLCRLEESTASYKRLLTLVTNPTEIQLIKFWIQAINFSLKKKVQEFVDYFFTDLATQLDKNSWELYRLSWWFFESVKEHPTAQAVAAGGLVNGLGQENLLNKIKNSCSITDLKLKGDLVNFEEVKFSIEKKIIGSKKISFFGNKTPPDFAIKAFEDQANPEVLVIKNTSCYVWKFGTAFFNDGKIISDLYENDGLLAVFHKETNVPIKIQGTVLSLAYPFGGGFFHLMMDALASLNAVKKIGLISQIDKFYLTERQDYQINILETLGISKDKLIFASESSHILPEKLVVVRGSITKYPNFESKWWHNQFLKDSFLPFAEKSKNTYPKRIYLKRGLGTNGRSIENEVEFLNFIASYGFQSVQPETMEFCEQVKLFSESEIVIGLAGSAMINLVFLPVTATAIIIYHPSSPWKAYTSMSSYFGFNQICFFANVSNDKFCIDPDWMRIDSNSNLNIDIKKFQKTISFAVQQ